MQWACARTSNEYSSNNLGYFPDAQWTDKVTAVVEEDGWIGFASMDPFDRKVYYGKGVLDKYCAAEIDILTNKDLIEVIEVEE